VSRGAGRAALTLVLALHLALALAFNARVPLGGAPDEPAHAACVESLLHGRLPVWDWPARPEGYEAHQPPLYYAAAALWDLPLRGTHPALQLRWLRVFSTFLHLLALLCIWRMARLCLGPGVALAATAAAAALPMFAFIGASVSNDALANLAGSLLLWRWLEERRTPGGKGQALRLGALIGLGLNAKATLAAPALCVFVERVWAWRREGGTKAALARAALLGAAALVLCLPLFARNLTLYGDLWGLARTALYDPQRFGWARLPEWCVLFFQSFWGRFGWMTNPLPGWSYLLLLALSALALAGFVKERRRMLSGDAGVLLLFFGGVLAQTFCYGFLRSFQPQARFSFVALGAWAVLFVMGLEAWGEALPPAARRAVGVLLALGALGLDLLALRAL
jgi:hypothetical protein